MALSTADKINIGWLCGLYASNELQNGKLHGGLLDKRLPSLLFSVTQGLSWLNDIAPSNADIEPIGNYLISICKHYFKAINILDAGNSGVIPGIISGGTLFPLLVTGADFEDDGVTYNDPRILGFDLTLWVSHYNQEFQVAPGFFVHTSTGLVIVAPGFNANDFPFILIDKFNSGNGIFSSSQELLPIEIDYNLSVDGTLITNPNVTTAGQQVIISIKPNGHTYSWDTMFEFSDTFPETPSPIGVNTLQIYTFSFLASANKLVCVSQSLNVLV